MSNKRILDATSGHLSNYDQSGHIKPTLESKYRDVISKLFPTEKRRSLGSQQRLRWTTYRQ
jgi:hypothetical protein